MPDPIDYYAIAAAGITTNNPETPDQDFWIGHNNDLPWQRRLPTDLAFLRRTLQAKITAAIFGRNTFASIPIKHLPIGGETTQNIIVSKTLRSEAVANIPNIHITNSFPAAIELAQNLNVQAIAACGGHQIYQAAFADPRFQTLFLTVVYGQEAGPNGTIQPFVGDTTLPNPQQHFSIDQKAPVRTENDIFFQFTKWRRVD